MAGVGGWFGTGTTALQWGRSGGCDDGQERGFCGRRVSAHAPGSRRWDGHQRLRGATANHQRRRERTPEADTRASRARRRASESACSRSRVRPACRRDARWTLRRACTPYTSCHPKCLQPGGADQHVGRFGSRLRREFRWRKDGRVVREEASRSRRGCGYQPDLRRLTRSSMAWWTSPCVVRESQ